MPEVFSKRECYWEHFGGVYVGRPTKWGNPFAMRGESHRQEVIDKYREWLMTQPDLIEQAKTELRGQNLICWCAPLPCHADVLMEVANAP